MFYLSFCFCPKVSKCSVDTSSLILRGSLGSNCSGVFPTTSPLPMKWRPYEVPWIVQGYRLKLSLESRSPGSLSTWHFPSAINNIAILKADSSIMFYAAEFKLVWVAQCYTYFRQRLWMLMKHMKCCTLNHLFCPLNDLWGLRCDWYDCGDWYLSLRRLKWQISSFTIPSPTAQRHGQKFW